MLKQVVRSQRITSSHHAFRTAPLASVRGANFASSSDEKPLNEPLTSGQEGNDGGGRRRGGFFFKFVGISLLGAGGVATACYLNNDVRKQLETSIPYFKEAEEKVLDTFSQFISSEKHRDSNIEKRQNRVSDKAKVETLPPQIQSMSQSAPKSVEKKQEAPPVTKSKESTAKSKQAEEKAALEQMLKKKADEEKRAKESAAKNRERILTDIAIKSGTMERAVLDAISSQILLETKIREHSSLLRKAIANDPTSENGDLDAWAAVANAHEARVKALAGATQMLALAESEIAGLKSALDEGKNESALLKNQIYQDAQKKLIQMKYDLSTAQENTQKADGEATSIEIYKDLVDRGKREFLKEIESVKPMRLKPSKDSKMSEDEWNFLIAHAHRRVEQLQRRIAALEMDQKKLIDTAVDLQRAMDESVFERKLLSELERQKDEFYFDKQKVEAEAREAFEVELREALARQATAHSDHLVHVLRVQREEQNQRFELETRERLIREREEFRAAIEKWINRVRGLEAAVDQRAEVERQGQLSHKLWLACQTFADVMLKAKDQQDLVPMKEHVDTVLAASGEDPVLSKILENVGDVARDRGVFSLEALGRRFRRVKSVCKSVALLDENEVSLFKLALSWIQSFFIFERAVIFAAGEEVSEEQLDTFTILSNAEEHIQSGDLETALKFMAQLKGLPRAIAHDWILECRRTLETRLVATILMAFAGDRSARAILNVEKESD